MKNKWILLCFIVFCLPSVQGAEGNRENDHDKLYAAIRANDLDRLKSLLSQGISANLSDGHQITPLMSAAEIGSVEAMRVLIAYGAEVNAENAFGATALMWSATNVAKVRLLLDHRADVNRASKQGRTALMVAALSSPSTRIVRLLLAAGANPRAVDKNGLTTLNAAAMGNDTATIRMLADAGVDVNAADKTGPQFNGSTPLMNAAMNGNIAAVRFLLARGARVNAVSPRDALVQVKNGSIALGGFTPLLLAAPFGSPHLIQLLLDAGADVNATDVRGMTPLMLAIASDHQNPETVRILLAHGADTKRKDAAGETALDWARKMGSVSAMEALGGGPLPVAPAAQSAPAVDHRTAVQRGVQLLEKGTGIYFVNSGCFGCHAQIATHFAVVAASTKKITVDQAAARERMQQITSFLNLMAPSLMERMDPPAASDFLLYPLEAMLRAGYKPDHLTDFLASEIASLQYADGRWHLGGISRSPMEDGDFTRTALAIRALKSYGTPGRGLEMNARIEHARRWLLHNAPVTGEDRAMRLVGMAAAGADAETLRALARPILETQRPDGGWAQKEGFASDAYATGMTLWALAEARIVIPSGDTYQRGVKFLLATQRPDGSWFVASRSVTLQPYFEGGFPHGRNQWISSMATGWATAALALALDQPQPVQVLAPNQSIVHLDARSVARNWIEQRR